MKLESDPGVRVERVILAVLFAAAVVALATVAVNRRPSAVQTSARTIDCPKPGEFERLHIIVVVRDGRLSVDECLYVGSRGTYGKGR